MALLRVEHRFARSVGWVTGLVAALAAGSPETVVAQSLAAGAVRGSVVDSAGAPLFETDVTIRNRRTGIARTTTTGRAGEFLFTLLPRGEYEASIEHVGFRPTLVVGIPVEAGSGVALEVALNPVLPPVTTIDTVAFDRRRVAAGTSLAWRAGDDLAGLADPLRRASGAAALFSPSDLELGVAGLPGRMGLLAVDGVVRNLARHPLDQGGALDALAFPLEALSRAEVRGIDGDAEWPAVGGGALRVASREGANRLRGSLSAFGGAEDRRASAVVWGPIIRDTASFIVGATAQRLDVAAPALWPTDSFTLAADSIARDSTGRDLRDYLAGATARTDLLSAFGRFDWQLTPAHSVLLRANAGRLTSSAPDLGTAAPALGTSLLARDLGIAAALTSQLPWLVGSELRISVDASDRSYTAPGALPLTTFVREPLVAGAGAEFPAEARRTTVRGSETLQRTFGRHTLKAGFALRYDSHDLTFAPGRLGSFVFDDTSGLGTHRGIFTGTTGSGIATFDVHASEAYLQDLWTPAPGLALEIGLRTTRERLPDGVVAPNVAWQQATGISTAAIPHERRRTFPRFSFEWALGPARQLLIRGAAGRYSEEFDPAILADVMTHDGSIAARRGFGVLSAWPGLPDTATARVMGPVLTFLHPAFEAPVTNRGGLSLSRATGTWSSVQIGGEYRHTDFLARRRDLNVRTTSGLHDQYGRAVVGTLRKDGGLVAADPGSNRRFGNLDAVTVLEPSGYSEYVGATVALQRSVPSGLAWWASYTFSRTRDNWFGARAADPMQQLSPFPDSAGGTADWSVGRSDFDVPHRAVIGAELRTRGRVGVRLAALWRWRAGLPFTPGFRGGVDVNGDGVAGNDPAFVTDSLPGDTVGATAAVIAANPCLHSQLGRFAVRNSCREPSAGSLDLRLALDFGGAGGRGVEFLVDAINVFAPDVAPVDHALYLVDPAAALTTAAGTVTVPLAVNPSFGRRLASRVPAVMVRAGLRIGL